MQLPAYHHRMYLWVVRGAAAVLESRGSLVIYGPFK